MDINAGKLLRLEASVDEVGEEIPARCWKWLPGRGVVPKASGRQEFVLPYKSFEPIGRHACLDESLSRTAALGQLWLVQRGSVSCPRPRVFPYHDCFRKQGRERFGNNLEFTSKPS
jgi:hypothetical protein